MSSELESNITTSDNNMKILLSLFSPQKIKISEHYFVIKGESALGSLTGLVSVNQVMDILYPEKSIDWTQVPFSYLQSLFTQSFSQLLFPFSTEPMTLLVDNIYLEDKKERSYPVIDTEIGNVFICNIIGKYEWNALPNRQISSTVKFIFGYSKISISLLKTLSLGDVFLIDEVSFLILVGNKKRIKFKWNGENIVEINALSNEAETEEKVEIKNLTKEKVDLESIGTIPVTVSFILASQALLIEQIECLLPGEKITLPENITRHIILTVNGTAIAQGELVKVDDRFAVEIQHLYTSCE